jgi:ribosomal-protein-alanine N-acetyltransferase
MTTLFGSRVVLRPLLLSDFPAWRNVRRDNAGWLLPWEPQRLPGQPDSTVDRDAFAIRCSARERERQLGTGHGFGIFVEGELAGEINLNAIQRGPFQNAYVGYWIAREHAGAGYVPEALVVTLQMAFEELNLHRVQVAIIPRNQASHRVVEKLGFRNEGVAERYLEINGCWEDHVRYAMTAEDWQERGPELVRAWID